MKRVLCSPISCLNLNFLSLQAPCEIIDHVLESHTSNCTGEVSSLIDSKIQELRDALSSRASASEILLLLLCVRGLFWRQNKIWRMFCVDQILANQLIGAVIENELSQSISGLDITHPFSWEMIHLNPKGDHGVVECRG
jgi:hypothetical protein